MHIKTETVLHPTAGFSKQPEPVGVQDRFEKASLTTASTQRPPSLRELIGNPNELRFPEDESSEKYLSEIYTQRDQFRTLAHKELLQLREKLEKSKAEYPESEQTFFEKLLSPGPDHRARMHTLFEQCIAAVDKTTKSYKVYSWSNGNRYEGNWENEERNGHGILTNANGDRYEGNWKNGKAHDHGILTLGNRYKYEGNWKNGKRSGQGTFRNLSDITISGEWSNDFFTKPVHENMGNPIFIGDLTGNDLLSGGPNGFVSTVLESYISELKEDTTEDADKTWLNQCFSVIHRANQMDAFPLTAQELLDQIRNLPEKNSLTINYMTIDHAMVLQISKDKNEFEFSIYNSGDGLRFHKSEKSKLKTKYETVKRFKIQLENVDIGLATEITNSAQESVASAYRLFSSRALPEVPSNLELDSSRNLKVVFQSRQKSNNCQLECWMAWMKNTAPSLHAYTRFRKRLLELALKKSESDPEMQRLTREKPDLANKMLQELQRKIIKRIQKKEE